MSYHLSKRSLQKLSECDDDLEILAKEAIKESPYDFGISWGYRSPVKQRDLFLNGRDTDGNIIDKRKIVTYVDGFNKKSKHNYMPALAFDIVAYVLGKVTWEPAIYLEIGTHIMEVAEDLFEKGLIKSRITWGGHWKKFKDWPHFQI